MKINFKSVIVCASVLSSFGSASAATGTLVNQVFKYDLAAGANSQVIALPGNRAVALLGTQLTVNFRGVAQATLLRVPNSFIQWVGLESAEGSVITQGFSSKAGTHILYLDFSHEVDVRVNSANNIIIHNASKGFRTGQITLTYSK